MTRKSGSSRCGTRENHGFISIQPRLAKIEKAPHILAKHVVDRFLNRFRVNPFCFEKARNVASHIFLIESRFRNAIRKAIERLGAIDQVGENERRDLAVIFNNVALGEPILRKINFVEICESWFIRGGHSFA